MPAEIYKTTFQCPDTGYTVIARFARGRITITPANDEDETDPETRADTEAYCAKHSGHRAKTIEEADDYIMRVADGQAFGFDIDHAGAETKPSHTAAAAPSTHAIASYDTKPTETEYTAFQAAYDSYNRALFAGELPQCLITLQRKRGAAGYFWHGQFRARSGEATTDEIALNPEGFADLMQILQTLVHEMCHLWQAHFGKPSRSGYHNKEWADKMIAVGLIPSHNGQPGGKQTGQSMSDYPDPSGRFIAHTQQMIADGFTVHWQATPREQRPPKPPADPAEPGEDAGDDDDDAAPSPKNKIKYSCATCGQNAWAKPNARLICGECEERMDAQP